jgi:hypothetical protein
MSSSLDIAHRGEGVPLVAGILEAFLFGGMIAVVGGACAFTGIFESSVLSIFQLPTFWLIQGLNAGLWVLLGSSSSRLAKTRARFGGNTPEEVLKVLLPYESLGNQGRLNAAGDLVDSWQKSSRLLWSCVALLATLGPVLSFFDLAKQGFQGWHYGVPFIIYIVEYGPTLFAAVLLQRRWDILVQEWSGAWMAAADSAISSTSTTLDMSPAASETRVAELGTDTSSISATAPEIVESSTSEAKSENEPPERSYSDQLGEID